MKMGESGAHLVWICPNALADVLDAASWLQPTRELRAAGWKVTLISPGESGLHTVSGVEILGIPMPNIYLVRQAIFHLRLLGWLLRNRKGIDVILFSQLSGPWVLPLRILRPLNGGRPLLVMDTRTVPMELAASATTKDRIRAVFYNLMNKFANLATDGQTATTERMADRLKIPTRQRWGTWPSGADLSLFKVAGPVRCWPQPGEALRVIYVGVLHHERNLLALSQAVELANQQGMRIELMLVGEGTARPELETFAAQTGGRVRVLPPVPHEQVPGLLAQAHIGALPFPNEEQFKVSSPIKLFEYMAAGLPVLATRMECHTDVMGTGAYTFWAEESSPEGLLEALKLAWQARDELSRMGKEAQTAAQGWSWQCSAMKLKESLEYGLRDRKSLVRDRR